MARRKSTELDVRTVFDASRIASQVLADAYERLVPIPRRATRPIVVSASPLDPADTVSPRWRVKRG
jgi:hypothetical protein